jgi:hypothetical protein
MAKDKEDVSMQGKTKWRLSGAIAFGLLVGSVVATGVSAQTSRTPGAPGTGICPGPAMMGAGFGPGARGMTGAGLGPGVMHEAVASALCITSQELWTAQAAGKSVATMAQEGNVDLTAVVDTALAAHSAQLAVAVKAGRLTQAQADAMQAFIKARIESGFQGITGGSRRRAWPSSSA